MKKVIVAVLVVLLVVGAYLTYNIESIFAKSSPVYVGEGVSNTKILENIESLDIDTSTRADIIDLFGEPESYIWGDLNLSIDELSGFYIMVYSEDFHIWMLDNSIAELRYYSDFYQTPNGISVGMSVDDVLEKLEQPSEVRNGASNGFVDYVLYEDIDDKSGLCYYSSPKDKVRFFFTDYKVNAMYVTRTDQDEFINNFKNNQSNNSTVSQKRVNVDNIDLPFVNDEEVIGTWTSVDFVDEISQFDPDVHFWSGDLYLKELVFEAEGDLSVRYLKWTKGIVMHSGDETASAYTIKEIDDETYMFFEWKSGDYVFRDMKPSYYVLKKEK